MILRVIVQWQISSVSHYLNELFELFVMEGLIDSFRADWPWWDDLHVFWRELPNYNTVGVSSSQPGTDHAAAATNLYAPAPPATSSVTGEDNEDDDDDDDREPRREVLTESGEKEESEVDIMESEPDGNFSGGDEDIQVRMCFIVFNLCLKYVSTVTVFANKIGLQFKLG